MGVLDSPRVELDRLEHCIVCEVWGKRALRDGEETVIGTHSRKSVGTADRYAVIHYCRYMPGMVSKNLKRICCKHWRFRYALGVWSGDNLYVFCERDALTLDS